MKATSNTKKIKVHPAAIKLLTDSTWEFARNILWSNCSFSDVETELAKIYIKEYYLAIPPEYFSQSVTKYFSEYCERVVMAKRYVDRYSNRYIPHPCIWTNKRNPKGFAGTKSWYDARQKERGLQRLLGELRHFEQIISQFELISHFKK